MSRNKQMSYIHDGDTHHIEVLSLNLVEPFNSMNALKNEIDITVRIKWKVAVV